MYVVSVYVTNDALAVNKTFSYKSDDYIENFKRVKVIFNHVKTNGIVVACVETDIEEFEKTNGFKLSSILEVLDPFPIIDERQFELAKWLSRTTISPFINCLYVKSSITFPLEEISIKETCISAVLFVRGINQCE